MAETADVNSIARRPDARRGKPKAVTPIETPEEIARAQEFTGFVERIRDLTHDIKELRIGLIHPKTIEFIILSLW
jgi:hypothetical protein